MTPALPPPPARTAATARRGAAISRRRFIELCGGGIVVLVGITPLVPRAQVGKSFYPEDFNAYLTVGADGRVTVFSGKIEMGQGVMTSQAQMVAEELGVSLASIDMVLGDTDRCPLDMGTFGSLTTRMFGPALRAAAAQARVTLVTLASRQLGVPIERLRVVDGVVGVADDPARTVRYATLAKGAAIAQVVDAKAGLRRPEEFSVMGSSPARLDGREKVTGAARYAADMRLPNMVYARLLRPAVHGATLLHVETAAAKASSGVVVIEQGDLVAVLHADPEAAEAALGKITAQWQPPAAAALKGLDPETIFSHLVAQAAPLKTIGAHGDVDAQASRAQRRFNSTFQKGYVAHAAVEPHAALASIADGKATVWASTQTPFPTRDRIAAALGMDTHEVRVITPLVGGGFGGKSADAQALEAARLAQIAGVPVQVAWTRAEEFFSDTFDPASVVEIGSGLTADGKILFVDYTVYSAGDRGAASYYDIAHTRFRSTGSSPYGAAAAGPSLHPFAVGPWRGPGASMNCFAMESQIDIMAAAAAQDPLAFRLRNLSDPRMRRVLEAAADAFGWRPAAGPSRRGMGLACFIDAGTYVATMAQVEADAASGHIQVMRVVCALDMGVVVNPEGARMQAEGAVTMGLGYALSEELRFRDGDVLDRNFDSYALPRFSWVPRIEVVLVSNDALAPQGAGEPPIVTTGAAIANAIFDATGARLFRLPMTPSRVKQALATLQHIQSSPEPDS
jgi:isoquinoline 1-oxidoreductase